jgi:NitT/TauT family transport system permease protein
LALVWKIVLVVELLGASSGMGFKLGEFFQFFEIDAVLAYALTFVLIIVALETLLVRPWESRVMRWR